MNIRGLLILLVLATLLVACTPDSSRVTPTAQNTNSPIVKTEKVVVTESKVVAEKVVVPRSPPTIGDTIKNGESSVTFTSVREDYIPFESWIETAYDKNAWTEDEQADIKRAVGIVLKDFNKKPEMTTYLETTYGGRLPKKLIYQQLMYTIDQPTENLPTFFGEPIRNWLAYAYLKDTGKAYNERPYNDNRKQGDFSIPVDDAEGEGYLIVSIDLCFIGIKDITEEEILAIRGGEKCPDTFIFDINLN